MVLCLLYLQRVSAAFAVVSSHTRSQRARLYRHSMELKMGMLDNLKKVGSFLQDRQNDFVKLDPDDNYVFGPGPAMLLIDCPSGISSSEIMDMVEDGAPVASKCGVSIRRIKNAGKGDGKLQGNVRLFGRFCNADKYSIVLRMAREARK